MDAEQHDKQWGEIVAKAWADASFKARLLAEPEVVLKENGVPVAPGVEVKVVEDTERTRYLTLPAKPTGELSDEELARVAGGVRKQTCWLE